MFRTKHESFEIAIASSDNNLVDLSEMDDFRLQVMAIRGLSSAPSKHKFSWEK